MQKRNNDGTNLQEPVLHRWRRLKRSCMSWSNSMERWKKQKWPSERETLIVDPVTERFTSMGDLLNLHHWKWMAGIPKSSKLKGKTIFHLHIFRSKTNPNYSRRGLIVDWSKIILGTPDPWKIKVWCPKYVGVTLKMKASPGLTQLPLNEKKVIQRLDSQEAALKELKEIQETRATSKRPPFTGVSWRVGFF